MATLQWRFKTNEVVFFKTGKALRTQKRIISRVYNQRGCFDGVEKPY